jgi:hypothetical protein
MSKVLLKGGFSTPKTSGFRVFSEMAGGDTTVGSRPATPERWLASSSRVRPGRTDQNQKPALLRIDIPPLGLVKMDRGGPMNVQWQ